jgi:hypothetical protein
MQRQDHSRTLKFGVAREESFPSSQFKKKTYVQRNLKKKSYRIIFFDKIEGTVKRLSNVHFNGTKPHKILRYCPRDFKCQRIIPIITRLFRIGNKGTKLLDLNFEGTCSTINRSFT